MGSVVVHSSYKTSQLKALADDFPQHRQPSAAIQPQLFDLKKEVVKQHVRHPDFHAFTSIKYVGPALVDDLSHGGLAIRNGDAAMLLYEAVAAGRVTADERQRILDDLREHCGTDTMVLVKPLKRFQELAQ